MKTLSLLTLFSLSMAHSILYPAFANTNTVLASGNLIGFPKGSKITSAKVTLEAGLKLPGPCGGMSIQSEIPIPMFNPKQKSVDVPVNFSKADMSFHLEHRYSEGLCRYDIFSLSMNIIIPGEMAAVLYLSVYPGDKERIYSHYYCKRNKFSKSICSEYSSGDSSTSSNVTYIRKLKGADLIMDNLEIRLIK